MPGIAHGEADGEDEEGVQSHAGSQSERFLGIYCHDECSYYSSQYCGGEYCVCIHALRGKTTEDVGVYGQDVGHGEEGGNTCSNLCFQLVLNWVKTE